jgi:hypothetical protein
MDRFAGILKYRDCLCYLITDLALCEEGQLEVSLCHSILKPINACTWICKTPQHPRYDMHQPAICPLSHKHQNIQPADYLTSPPLHFFLSFFPSPPLPSSSSSPSSTPRAPPHSPRPLAHPTRHHIHPR